MFVGSFVGKNLDVKISRVNVHDIRFPPSLLFSFFFFLFSSSRKERNILFVIALRLFDDQINPGDFYRAAVVVTGQRRIYARLRHAGQNKSYRIPRSKQQ